MSAPVYSVRLADINFDESTQCRAALDEDTIDSYAAAMKGGAEFPPVTLFQDAQRRYHIGDGWHRLRAMQRNSLVTVPATVANGGRTAAIKFALSANARHGLRRTNADKRRAIAVALKEFPRLSDREIASVCDVSHPLVSEVRKDSATPATGNQLEEFPTERRIGKDGKTYRPTKPAKGEDLDGDDDGEDEPEDTAPGDSDSAADATPEPVKGEFGAPPPEPPPPPWSLEREGLRAKRAIEGIVAAAPAQERDNLARFILHLVIELYGEPTPEAPAAPKKKDKPEDVATAIYKAFPRRVGKKAALKAIKGALATTSAAELLQAVQAFAAAVAKWPAADRKFIPHPATWFNRGSYEDDPKEWERGQPAAPEIQRKDIRP